MSLTACIERSPLPEVPGDAGSREIDIIISGVGQPAVDTKSSVTASEDGIRSATLLFYKDGILEEKLIRTTSFAGNGVSNCTISVELMVGSSYDILAMINSAVTEAPSQLRDALAGLSYGTTDINSWNSRGLPMAGHVHYYVSTSDSSVEIPLTRLVAKLNFTISTSDLKHGSIKFTSMQVRQMNASCPFFAEGKAVNKVCDGDIASSSDLAGVNAGTGGYSCSFYILENMQGDILSGNRDPDAKVPAKVQAAGGDPGMCTYLEIKGNYSGSSGHLSGAPLTARMFLGADAFSNFDIERNRQYNIALNITDEGCLKTDWKIDGNLQDSRELKFYPETSSLDPGGTSDVQLLTNLSYTAGDYSYSLSGDLAYFDFIPFNDATLFSIGSRSSTPEGAQLVITASTWDGRITSVHRATAASAKSARYDYTWQSGGNVLYLAQRGTLYIVDADTGRLPSGTVSVSGSTGVADVSSSGAYWQVDAVKVGDDILTVKVDGRTVREIPLSCLAPVLKFSSDRIFLSIDGNVTTCGPYYHKVDGSLLEYNDFVPELYEELLDVSIQRDISSQKFGKSWRRGQGGGNPAVKCKLMASTHSVFGFYLSKLEADGVGIDHNYDFSDGPVSLEKVLAYPNDREGGVEPAAAELYTEDPFAGSEYLGERNSWALARWYSLSDRNESFTFSFDNLLLPGNDAAEVSFVYPFSEEGKYEFTHIDSNTIMMTILYNDNVETAMPEHYFAFAPAIRNRNSGQTYLSCHRLSVDFTVNLAVAGVASENGAGGCDVSVEWAFPRKDEGRLSYIEKNAVAAYSDAGTWNKGMYGRLYVVHGYTPDYIREMEMPAYSFADLDKAPSEVSPVTGSSYHIPEGYGGGYDLVMWRYEQLFPYTNGWLSK